MICPECKSEGKKSRVFREWVKFSHELSAFYQNDKEDKEYYDPNACIISYQCSRMHKWVEFAYSSHTMSHHGLS